MNATHTFTDSFLYEQCDVPPGKSLREWRRSSAVETAKTRRPSPAAWLHMSPRRQLSDAR